MRGSHRSVLKGTLAAVVASGSWFLRRRERQRARCPRCARRAPNVARTGRVGAGIPTGSRTPSIPDASNAIACIPANKTVTGVNFRTVNQVHVDSGSVVDVPPRGELFFDGNPTLAQLSGPGRLDVRGTAQVDGGLSMRSAVRMTISGAGTTSVQSDSFITADWGT